MSYPGGILLAIDTVFTEGTAEVVLRGELDFAITPELLEQLADVLDKKPGRLVFDMQGVTFIDCGAAAALARTAQVLPDGTKPEICNPSDVVRRLLRASRLDMFFQLDEAPPSGSVVGQGAGEADQAGPGQAADLTGTDGRSSDDPPS